MYCTPPTVCGEVTLSVHELLGVQASISGVVIVPGSHPVPEVETVRPDGALVISTVPFGIDGTNDTPRKTEPVGAVSSNVNVVPGLVIVVVVRVSVIP
jgi:hypothetical protein